MDLLNALTNQEKIEIFLVLVMDTHQSFTFDGKTIFFPISPRELDKIELFLRNKHNGNNYELINHN